MREKLIELLTGYFGVDTAYYGIEAQHLADYLVSNGVTIPIRCKDCKRWKYDARKLCGFCDALICYRPDYFWCMYGERRTDD